MTATRVPPTSRPRALTTVRSRFSSEDARLYGSHDRQDLFDPLARLEDLGQARPLLPERRDDRLMRAVDHLGRQPQRGDVIRHVLDLCGCRVRFHDHDHGDPSSTMAVPQNQTSRPKKKAPEPDQGAGALCVCFGKSSRSLMVDAPSSARQPVVSLVNDPGPPPAAVRKQADTQSIARAAGNGIRSRDHKRQSNQNLRRNGFDQADDPERAKTWSIPTVRLWSRKCGCPTGNPSAAVRRAAPGYHYTRDHLLSF